MPSPNVQGCVRSAGSNFIAEIIEADLAAAAPLHAGAERAWRIPGDFLPIEGSQVAVPATLYERTVRILADGTPGSAVTPPYPHRRHRRHP